MVIPIQLYNIAIAMQHFSSSLLALSLLTFGSAAIAQSSTESNNSTQYPEEFRQEYATECLQTSMGEGLGEEEAKSLCDCTLNKFQSQYQLEEFKQLTINSRDNKKAEAVLVEVGQVCFEEILYEQ